jgi:MFS family permease
VLVALFMMRIEPRKSRPKDDSPLRSFVQGFQFAMKDVPIRSALLMLSLLSLFGLQYAVFLPIYAHDILHGGAKALGLLMSAAGVGAVLGALQFAARTHYKGLAKWIATTCTTCAIGLIVMSHATSFWLCAAVLFVVGFAATSQMAATNTIIQERVPEELRSRLMAVYATMFMGVQPIGALLAGGVAKRIGTPDALLLLGSIVLAGCIAFIYFVATKFTNSESATPVIVAEPPL